jgi:SAM-dependent methyltransferase
VVAHAAQAAETLNLAQRCQAVGGSFFETVPEGDLHLLRFILHDWTDEKAIRILDNCRRAMRPGGRLVIIEAYLGEPGQRAATSMVDNQVALIDLHMLLMGNGRERSIAEYDALLDAAGLRRGRITPLPSGYVMIEAGIPNGAHQA